MNSTIKLILVVIIPFIFGLLMILVGLVPLLSMEEYVIGTIVEIIGIVPFIISIIQWRKYKSRCKTCGKWGALNIVKRDLINKQDTTKTKTLVDKRKNRQGEIIETVEKQVVVPATRYTYLVNEKCRFCGQIYEYKQTDTVEK